MIVSFFILYFVIIDRGNVLKKIFKLSRERFNIKNMNIFKCKIDLLYFFNLIGYTH